MGNLAKTLEFIEQTESLDRSQQSSHELVLRITALTEDEEIEWAAVNPVPEFLRGPFSGQVLAYRARIEDQFFVLAVIRDPYQSAASVVTLIATDKNWHPVFVFPSTDDLSRLHSAVTWNSIRQDVPQNTPEVVSKNSAGAVSPSREELLVAALDYNEQKIRMQLLEMQRKRIFIVFLSLIVSFFLICLVWASGTILVLHFKHYNPGGTSAGLFASKIIIFAALFIGGGILGVSLGKRARNAEERKAKMRNGIKADTTQSNSPLQNQKNKKRLRRM